MSRTMIKFNYDDSRYHDWEKGDEGYIDGYFVSDHGAPQIVVINLRTKRPVITGFGDMITVTNGAGNE